MSCPYLNGGHIYLVDGSHQYGALLCLFLASKCLKRLYVIYISSLVKSDTKVFHIGGSCLLAMATNKCGHGFRFV
jgi:hypothetical protein